ncbi:MAG: winged helix DNA-binding domain-containing protein [Methanobacterium sp. ERen5]|nr:MAG: winged helix DNA-binding domain-containing protein [Methanobacterium sp. ERen5]
MEFEDIAIERLESQHMGSDRIRVPSKLVSWLMAVQAQEYDGAKWSIGLRLRNKTDKYIENALKSKKIVRTWANRGTLHFVNSEDIKWLLKLIGPRLIQRNARRYRELELDEKTLKTTGTILEEALSGTKGIKRSKLREILIENKISTDGQRFTFILQRASLEGLIHQGISIKNDPIYHSSEDLPSPQPTNEEALKEISKRYFHSHGPATLKDFVWWSGLTVNNAKTGLKSIKSELNRFDIGNKTYWSKISPVNQEGNFKLGQTLKFFHSTMIIYWRTRIVEHPLMEKLNNF